MNKFAFCIKTDNSNEIIANGMFFDWKGAVKFFSITKGLNIESFLKLYKVFEIK